MPFQDYRQFIDLYDQSTLEDRANIYEFYLHNMALIDMNVWDPSVKIGDLHLMDFSSWMNHEDAMATEMKQILAREQTEPLMIRAKQSNLMVVINTHNLIENYLQLLPRYISTQEKSISCFEDTFRLLGDENM